MNKKHPETKKNLKKIDERAQKFAQDHPIIFGLIGAATSLVASVAIKKFFSSFKKNKSA